jgi:hypothetical protein
VVKCTKKYNKSEDKDTHCFLPEKQNEGWYCRFLTDMPRHIPASRYDYVAKRYHWFNFGHFENNCWIIHKDTIKQRLIEEAEDKFLVLCPHFAYQNIENILRSFPEKIDLDTSKDWGVEEKEIDTGFSLEIKKTGILPKRILEEKNMIIRHIMVVVSF